MKLYFLTGLPTETDEDTLGIAELARNCVALGRPHTKKASVTVSLGGFVPKPFTPFQWFGQNTTSEPVCRKVGLLRDDPAGARRAAQAARPRRHPRRGSPLPGRSSPRSGHRAGVREGGTFQEWSMSTSRSTAGLDAGG